MQLVSFFVEVYIREKVRWLSQWPANVFLKNEEHAACYRVKHLARYSPQLPRQSSCAILSFNCDGNAVNIIINKKSSQVDSRSALP